MKFLILFISLVIAVKGWKQKYGNDFVTYSIGERFDKGKRMLNKWTFDYELSLYAAARVVPKLNTVFFVSGDFLTLNDTIESKCVLYHWPRVHRLEYKIQNHDDLLSFAQIDIIDTDVGQNIWKYSCIDFSIFSTSFDCLGAARGAHQHSIKFLRNFGR